VSNGDNACSVHLGGKRRELIYATRAICFIEEATGKSFSDAASSGGITFLVVSVAAGLVHLAEFRKRWKTKDGDYDFSLVEEWMDAMPKADLPANDDSADTLRSLGSKVAAAMRGGMPGVRITPTTEEEAPSVPTKPPSP